MSMRLKCERREEEANVLTATRDYPAASVAHFLTAAYIDSFAGARSACSIASSETLAAESRSTRTVMIDATHLKAHRTAASLLKKGAFPAVLGARRAA